MGADHELGELSARVQGLENSLADFRAESRQAVREIKTIITQTVNDRLNDHSRRLRGLERWRSYIAGGLAVLAAVLTFGKWLVSFLFVGGSR